MTKGAGGPGALLVFILSSSIVSSLWYPHRHVFRLYLHSRFSGIGAKLGKVGVDRFCGNSALRLTRAFGPTAIRSRGPSTT